MQKWKLFANTSVLFNGISGCLDELFATLLDAEPQPIVDAEPQPIGNTDDMGSEPVSAFSLVKSKAVNEPKPAVVNEPLVNEPKPAELGVDDKPRRIMTRAVCTQKNTAAELAKLDAKIERLQKRKAELTVVGGANKKSRRL